jgi:hypothetical protein
MCTVLASLGTLHYNTHHHTNDARYVEQRHLPLRSLCTPLYTKTWTAGTVLHHLGTHVFLSVLHHLGTHVLLSVLHHLGTRDLWVSTYLQGGNKLGNRTEPQLLTHTPLRRVL